MMQWSKCETEFIVKVTPDGERIASIIEMAMNRKNFIEQNQETKDNTSFIVEGYYEIIKELLVALLLQNGLKSKNHQCLITYFQRNYPDYEFEANLISKLSYLRNRLNYYGERINLEYYNKNKINITGTIEVLLKLLKF